VLTRARRCVIINTESKERLSKMYRLVRYHINNNWIVWSVVQKGFETKTQAAKAYKEVKAFDNKDNNYHYFIAPQSFNLKAYFDKKENELWAKAREKENEIYFKKLEELARKNVENYYK
jgi:hypothetical protein